MMYNIYIYIYIQSCIISQLFPSPNESSFLMINDSD